jgi:invasion protein IalB
MSLNFLRSSVAAAAVLIGGAALAQQAQAPAGGAPQQQQPQAPQPVVQDFVAVDPEWNKVCYNEPQTNKQVCQTTRSFGERADSPRLWFGVIDPAGTDKAIQVMAPMGVALRPGFRLAVDKGAPEGGAFEICAPQGSFGGVRVKQAFVDGMKKGDKLAISVRDLSGAEFTFNLPLAGFGKAFDGPGVDPKVAEERQKKLQEELMKKAEEERKKQEAQNAAKAPGAPAAPAKPPAGK